MGEQIPSPGEHVASHEGRETTLGDYGRRLTIGGEPIDIEPPGLPLRLRVGREVQSDPQCRKRLGLRFVRTLALVLRSIGDKDLTRLPLAERVAAAGQLAVVDMHYTSLLHLASEDAGRYLLPVDDECPRCRRQLPKRVPVQLDDTKITVFPEPPSVRYRMQDEWTHLTQPVEMITLGPPRVSRAFERLTAADLTVDDLRNAAWVSAAITHINGEPRTVTVEQLGAADQETGRGMSERDWRGLRAAFNAAYGNVEPGIRWGHDCGEKLLLELDWTESFFGRSRG